MTPPPSPPTRRRRRTVVALGVVLVLGGALWWATRPRIDARLVGTWTVTAEHGVYQVWQFDTNGIMHSRGVENPMYSGVGEPESEKWSVKGDVLYFGSSHPAWLEEVANWCDWNLGARLLGLQQAYQVVRIDDDTIRLDEPDIDLMYVILRRIPE